MKLIILTLMLTGCVTAADVNKKLDSWIGHHIDTVAQYWGAPQGKHTNADGTKVYTYTSSRVSSYESYDVKSGQYRTDVTNTHCKITLVSDREGYVEQARSRGHNIRCSRMIPPDPDLAH